MPVIELGTDNIIKPTNISTPWGNAIRSAIILMSLAISMYMVLFLFFKI